MRAENGERASAERREPTSATQPDDPPPAVRCAGNRRPFGHGPGEVAESMSGRQGQEHGACDHQGVLRAGRRCEQHEQDRITQREVGAVEEIDGEQLGHDQRGPDHSQRPPGAVDGERRDQRDGGREDHRNGDSRARQRGTRVADLARGSDGEIHERWRSVGLVTEGARSPRPADPGPRTGGGSS